MTTLKIIVEDGMVVRVEGLPPGYGFTVADDCVDPDVANGHAAAAATVVPNAIEQVRQLLTTCQEIVKLAATAHEHWDADRDHKVGKILSAMAGHRKGYLPETTRLHEVIAATEEYLKTAGTADDEVTYHKCGNCRATWTDDRLINPIPDLQERLTPGDPVPSGECPTCGALCYLIDVSADNEKA